jgi:hypothetical protein
MPLGVQSPLRNLRHIPLFYEIYPELTPHAGDEPGTWFEIALHLGVEEYRPPDHPVSRERFSVLMELAEFLVQRLQPYAPYGLDMPTSYYTLNLPLPGNCTQPRLACTASLVFSDFGLDTDLAEPPILTQLKAELSLLGIPRVDRS